MRVRGPTGEGILKEAVEAGRENCIDKITEEKIVSEREELKRRGKGYGGKVLGINYNRLESKLTGPPVIER